MVAGNRIITKWTPRNKKSGIEPLKIPSRNTLRFTGFYAVLPHGLNDQS